MPPAKSGFRFLPVTLVMGSIFFLSHQPGDSISLPNIVNIDKLLHCLLYAVLGLATILALSPRFRQQRPDRALLLVVRDQRRVPPILYSRPKQ